MFQVPWEESCSKYLSPGLPSPVPRRRWRPSGLDWTVYSGGQRVGCLVSYRWVYIHFVACVILLHICVYDSFVCTECIKPLKLLFTHLYGVSFEKQIFWWLCTLFAWFLLLTHSCYCLEELRAVPHRRPGLSARHLAVWPRNLPLHWCVAVSWSRHRAARRGRTGVWPLLVD